ncbi:DUF3055 domain-containing protein [Alicyclobacillus tolerans]|uniref:DUF3055 domain-containing protein n=1 Tax=Alicyclobacillus tolerans TaxID=90970 RepID=UPI001F30D1BA|nr:DUF3055 domain-containing protein [Alicyclobacillus tolerans]MCF8564507.1 DUF3055 domain-containing protein [Alicyclobacillus tolerans]
MSDSFLLYDETEETKTRYVGFVGNHDRYDLAIVTTAHFYGKKLVCVIQSGRTAILGREDAENVGYLMDAFNISDHEDAAEFSEFLTQNLY